MYISPRFALYLEPSLHDLQAGYAIGVNGVRLVLEAKQSMPPLILLSSNLLTSALLQSVTRMWWLQIVQI